MLLTLIVVAVLAPLVAAYPPDASNLADALAVPSAAHPLGSDSVGRDILSRIVWGSQTTLIGILIVAGTAFIVGVPMGLLAGYYGKAVDEVASWAANILLALPGVIVLLTVRAAFGPSLVITMVALGLMVSPSYFRLTAAAVKSVRHELYVEAAQVSGLSDLRIMRRHVLSVVRAPLIIHTAHVGGIAIGVQSALDFLGVGDPNTVTWGSMVGDAFGNIYLNQLNLLWPSLAIGLVTAAFVLLGSGLRDALEDQPKHAVRSPQKTSLIETNKGKENAQLPAPAEEQNTILGVRNLSLAYPEGRGGLRQVVNSVSLSVARGEVLGLVGESGSGKSQTAFAALGLLPASAVVTGGSISFDEKWLVAPGDQRIVQKRYAGLRGVRLAYVPQEPMSNLDPSFTIGYQLMRPLRKQMKMSKGEAEARSLELLASVGIADPARTLRAYPHEISGGMAQRVLIAGAISCEPDLLIADEPTTALDVTVQAEVLEVLRELQKRLKLGVLIITHNFGVVADICDRVAVMKQGEIVEQGQVRQIMGDPQHPYTQMLLKSMVASGTHSHMKDVLFEKAQDELLVNIDGSTEYGGLAGKESAK
ncbi:dipeptide/oligopeptide/nickel ABC transporter permease/ATP-binding protein [Paenarthrobacter sp. YIM B13468]|uniref:dipeptide/oligopeptide/nickel ABC transporter permease/ATP-binding protein n=1 Tax=Paenarthrobacter sp. YIM B13468 TaxID=3366295 RepID=UPI00366E7AE2